MGMLPLPWSTASSGSSVNPGENARVHGQAESHKSFCQIVLDRPPLRDEAASLESGSSVVNRTSGISRVTRPCTGWSWSSHQRMLGHPPAGLEHLASSGDTQAVYGATAPGPGTKALSGGVGDRTRETKAGRSAEEVLGQGAGRPQSRTAHHGNNGCNEDH
jgi:hypothetical protein